MREILRILETLVCSILHVIIVPSIWEQIQKSPILNRGMRTATKKPQTRKTRLHVTFRVINQLLYQPHIDSLDSDLGEFATLIPKDWSRSLPENFYIIIFTDNRVCEVPWWKSNHSSLHAK